MKLDGGLDLNSQMGFAPTTGFDRRDNRPGYVTDVWLGYEQAAQQLRYGPEKFGAMMMYTPLGWNRFTASRPSWE